MVDPFQFYVQHQMQLKKINFEILYIILYLFDLHKTFSNELHHIQIFLSILNYLINILHLKDLQACHKFRTLYIL